MPHNYVKLILYSLLPFIAKCFCLRIYNNDTSFNAYSCSLDTWYWSQYWH